MCSAVHTTHLLAHGTTHSDTMRVAKVHEAMLVVLAAIVLHGTPVTAQQKILCLHGGGQSGDMFRAMSGMQSLMSSASNFEFVFASGPGNLWFRDVPGGKSSTTTDPAWADDSVAILDGIVAAQGPFAGILGYSQGTAMASFYLSRAPPNTFQFAVNQYHSLHAESGHYATCGLHAETHALSHAQYE